MMAGASRLLPGPSAECLARAAVLLNRAAQQSTAQPQYSVSTVQHQHSISTALAQPSSAQCSHSTVLAQHSSVLVQLSVSTVQLSTAQHSPAQHSSLLTSCGLAAEHSHPFPHIPRHGCQLQLTLALTAAPGDPCVSLHSSHKYRATAFPSQGRMKGFR